MKHAIMIMAHKNAVQLKRLAAFFVKNCDVFIHIDQKSLITKEEISDIQSLPQVKRVLQTHSVHWGGTSVLDCEMNLLKVAYEESDADYFHLISGQDYPVRPLSYFLDFFEKNSGKVFIQYTHLPHPRWENNTFSRFQYYYPYDYASEKAHPRHWVWEQVKAQQEKGIKRPIPDEFDHLYGGSQWFSITREATQILLDYTNTKPAFYNKMWMTFAPEESYITTVLVNLIDKEKIENSNYRYIRWKNENGNRPANLSSEHFFHLLSNEYLFARKIEYPVSEPLLELIDQYLLCDKDVIQNQNGGWQYDGFLKYGFDASFSDFVAQFCREVNVSKALDMGCGSGYYVSKWRRLDLNFDGYDSNPYTPSLSERILQDGEKLCGVANLVGELDFLGVWDLVVCKDVLQYIPENERRMAISNLCNLSSHYIILSQTSQNVDGTICHPFDWESIKEMMRENGFDKDEYMTARIRVISTSANICTIYRKKGKDIIIQSK
ncbi:MAG: beta-1,6-N-acetylglucosaminyltransferase [Bacteroidales bacterium]|nr:beta-1,6-N-acetylglucosaminyltransferase [Bacteroidales bacterium]